MQIANPALEAFPLRINFLKLYKEPKVCRPTILHHICQESRQLALSVYNLVELASPHGVNEEDFPSAWTKEDTACLPLPDSLKLEYRLLPQNLLQVRHLAIKIQRSVYDTDYDVVPLIKHFRRPPQVQILTFVLHNKGCPYTSFPSHIQTTQRPAPPHVTTP